MEKQQLFQFNLRIMIAIILSYVFWVDYSETILGNYRFFFTREENLNCVEDNPTFNFFCKNIPVFLTIWIITFISYLSILFIPPLKWKFSGPILALGIFGIFSHMWASGTWTQRRTKSYKEKITFFQKTNIRLADFIINTNLSGIIGLFTYFFHSIFIIVGLSLFCWACIKGLPILNDD